MKKCAGFIEQSSAAPNIKGKVNETLEFLSIMWKETLKGVCVRVVRQTWPHIFMHWFGK